MPDEHYRACPARLCAWTPRSADHKNRAPQREHTRIAEGPSVIGGVGTRELARRRGLQWLALPVPTINLGSGDGTRVGVRKRVLDERERVCYAKRL